MKVLFLDIDGVLNGHDWDDEAKSCNIRRECVKELNRVVKVTGCKIVLSSAWRYMVHGGAMTLMGFAYMLRTHGLMGVTNFIGLTRKDRDMGDVNERGLEIREWLACNHEVKRYAAVDDEDIGHRMYGIPLVKTDGARGLTSKDADELIELLMGT